MKLYTLLFGRSKKKMRPIMTDEKHKCERYMNARTSNNGEKGCGGWHKIVEAEKDAEIWRKKSCTIGGNSPSTVKRITRHGNQVNGYIDKHGFNPHT